MLRLLRYVILALAAAWLLKKLFQLAAPPRPAAPGASRDDSRATAGGARTRTPFEVLNVPSSANREEIRRAYQALLMQYHPDKVATLGPELRTLAEQRTQELNAAYAELERQGRA